MSKGRYCHDFSNFPKLTFPLRLAFGLLVQLGKHPKLLCAMLGRRVLRWGLVGWLEPYLVVNLQFPYETNIRILHIRGGRGGITYKLGRFCII